MWAVTTRRGSGLGAHLPLPALRRRERRPAPEASNRARMNRDPGLPAAPRWRSPPPDAVFRPQSQPAARSPVGEKERPLTTPERRKAGDRGSPRRPPPVHRFPSRSRPPRPVPRARRCNTGGRTTMRRIRDMISATFLLQLGYDGDPRQGRARGRARSLPHELGPDRSVLLDMVILGFGGLQTFPPPAGQDRQAVAPVLVLRVPPPLSVPARHQGRCARPLTKPYKHGGLLAWSSDCRSAARTGKVVPASSDGVEWLSTVLPMRSMRQVWSRAGRVLVMCFASRRPSRRAGVEPPPPH